MKFCFLLPTFLLTLSPLLSHPLSLYLHIGSPFPRLSHRLVHCLLPPPRLAINPRLAFIIPLHFSLPAPLVRSLTTALFTLPPPPPPRSRFFCSVSSRLSSTPLPLPRPSGRASPNLVATSAPRDKREIVRVRFKVARQRPTFRSPSHSFPLRHVFAAIFRHAGNEIERNRKRETSVEGSKHLWRKGGLNSSVRLGLSGKMD